MTTEEENAALRENIRTLVEERERLERQLAALAERCGPSCAEELRRANERAGVAEAALAATPAPAKPERDETTGALVAALEAARPYVAGDPKYVELGQGRARRVLGRIDAALMGAGARRPEPVDPETWCGDADCDRCHPHGYAPAPSEPCPHPEPLADFRAGHTGGRVCTTCMRAWWDGEGPAASERPAGERPRVLMVEWRCSVCNDVSVTLPHGEQPTVEQQSAHVCARGFIRKLLDSLQPTGMEGRVRENLGLDGEKP